MDYPNDYVIQKHHEIAALQERIAALTEQKANAYHERNQLVAFVARIYPSHLIRHPDTDTEWENDWRWIVCVHSPANQMTWHIHDSERPLFDFLHEEPNHWDGHTTEQKYERLAVASMLPVR